MKAGDRVILAYHEPTAAMWGRGGKGHDEVSFAISDALAHAAQRLNARAGGRYPDVVLWNRLVRSWHKADATAYR